MKFSPIQAFPLITQWPEAFPERSPNRHGLEPRKINRLKGSIKHERIPLPMDTPERVTYATTRFYDRADQGLDSSGDAKITGRTGKIIRSPGGERGVYAISGAERDGETGKEKRSGNNKIGVVNNKQQ